MCCPIVCNLGQINFYLPNLSISWWYWGCKYSNRTNLTARTKLLLARRRFTFISPNAYGVARYVKSLLVICSDVGCHGNTPISHFIFSWSSLTFQLIITWYKTCLYWYRDHVRWCEREKERDTDNYLQTCFSDSATLDLCLTWYK